MSLIVMAVYSTEENKKDDCLLKTLNSLDRTVDFTRHRLMLSVNASTPHTERIMHRHGDIISHIVWNDGNIGTAEAINKCWKYRKPNEHAVKMDDDVVIHSRAWLDIMEESITRMPSIGIIALKRTDCWENTKHTDPQYRSELIEVPQQPGQRWIHLERAKHIIGTCQLYNSALLDKIGYLYQPSLYGYDDVLASYRSEIAGFINCFYPHVLIDHIDEGNTPYQDWKQKHSGEYTQQVIQLVDKYISGETPIYYNPFQ